RHRARASCADAREARRRRRTVPRRETQAPPVAGSGSVVVLMVNRFSLYDFIAVVIPGIFFLWAVGTLADVFALSKVVPLSGGITETSVLVVVGYVTGLLLQGISQHVLERMLLWWWGGFPSARWLLPDDARFTAQYKQEVAAA